MAKKHFIIYYAKGTGTYVTTEPKPWARENQNLFPNFNFVDKDNSPNTHTIENLLIAQYGFKIVYQDKKVSLIQNVNPNLEFIIKE